MTERLDLGKSATDLYQTVVELDRRVSRSLNRAGITEGFSHLLRLRASQINRCAFCVRLHARDALASGESSDRLAVLAVWKETDYFTLKERAALELVEAITLISVDQLPDVIYEQAAENLSSEEVSAVEWLAVVINTWNRIAISSRYPVRE
ncbi:MAG: carboxymuconolactone decarboxylase family protein [Gammaproteobacteria bacterium]|nr:carboxymuconolactone decarboxylase family protein [Gammaproteobacteria bacterium]